MVTRRRAIVSGLAFAALAVVSAAGSAGFAAPVSRSNRKTRPIDALLVDETIAMPHQLAAFCTATSRRLPVAGVLLDAANHSVLLRILEQSQAIVGISSGATLFCVERIGWDHGYRLSGRSEHSDCAAGYEALRRYVDALLDGASVPAPASSPGARTYRPSRTDATLHAWVLSKSAREAMV